MLEEFNFFANKAINQYINKRYNIYDINQQTTDDLRVLKATALLTPHRVDTYDGLSLASNATYYVDLPSDYLHLLNCICIYQVKKTYKCYNAGDTWRAAATRLTADAYSQVLDNFWLKPTYKRPYYYIHNVNTVNNGTVPTNPISNGTLPSSSNNENHVIFNDLNKITGGYKIEYLTISGVSDKVLKVITNYDNDPDHPLVTTEIINLGSSSGTDSASNLLTTYDSVSYGTDAHKNTIVNGSGLPTSIDIGGSPVSNVERGQNIRYGNVTKVRMEIRYGTDDSVFTLGEGNGSTGKIYIDYIKAPLHIRLTQEELDHTEDYSLMLEFPDYVCQEILNELVHIAMEHISDPRLQTHPVVSLSIANPAQALTPQAQGLSAQQ